MWQFAIPQRVVFGNGVLDTVGKEASRLGSRAYVVAAEGSMQKLGFLPRTVTRLKEAGLATNVFDGVQPNPTTVAVEQLAADVKKKGRLPDVIIALGGGSAIDFGKALAVALVTEPPVWDYVQRAGYTPKKAPQSTPPVIAIPTTAGTGSEVTSWSVITNPSTGAKPAIYDPAILPKVALVDPELTRSLPPALTAETGFDVLSHALEAYTGTLASPFSDLVALEAIRLVGANIETAVNRGNDDTARSNMAWASTLAGLAIEHAGTHLVHNMAHALGGVLDLPHGKSIAVCLPFVMEYCVDAAPERFLAIADALATRRPAKSTPRDSILRVKELLVATGMPLLLSDLGVQPSDIQGLVNHNVSELSALFNHWATPVGEKELVGLYERALGRSK